MKTDFNLIQFDPQWHTYHLNGTRLTGVTKYLKQFQKPFDRDDIAARVAARENRPVANVLAEWDAKGAAGIELGLRVHQYIEKTLNLHKNGVEITLANDPFLALNDPCPEITAFDTLFGQLKNKTEIIQVEWVMGDIDWGIAGTADALVFSSDTGQYHLWDWKTGKFDIENKWEKLLRPFAGFDACKLNIYSLQLSLYRLIIQRNTGLTLGDSYLFHLQDGGCHIYKAVDFRSQLIDHFEQR